MTKKVEAPKVEAPKVELVKVVVQGKSIVSKKRILKPGDVVTGEHFAGGEEVVDHFEKKGFIETKKVEK